MVRLAQMLEARIQAVRERMGGMWSQPVIAKALIVRVEGGRWRTRWETWRSRR